MHKMRRVRLQGRRILPNAIPERHRAGNHEDEQLMPTPVLRVSIGCIRFPAPVLRSSSSCSPASSSC
eukprot:863082-Amphidinium_carterae.1